MLRVTDGACTVFAKPVMLELRHLSPLPDRGTQRYPDITHELSHVSDTSTAYKITLEMIHSNNLRGHRRV